MTAIFCEDFCSRMRLEGLFLWRGDWYLAKLKDMGQMLTNPGDPITETDNGSG